MVYSNILIDTNVTQTGKCAWVSQQLSVVDSDFLLTPQMRKLKQTLRQFAEESRDKDSRDTIIAGILFQIQSRHRGDSQEVSAAP